MLPRQPEDVMRMFGMNHLSLAHVGRAVTLLNKKRDAWRNWHLGQMKYVILDARCEKHRHDGVARDVTAMKRGAHCVTHKFCVFLSSA